MRLAAVRVRARDETLRGKRARRGGALWGFGYVGCEGRTRGEISVGAFFFLVVGDIRVVARRSPRATSARSPESTRTSFMSCSVRLLRLLSQPNGSLDMVAERGRFSVEAAAASCA